MPKPKPFKHKSQITGLWGNDKNSHSLCLSSVTVLFLLWLFLLWTPHLVFQGFRVQVSNCDL